MEKYYHNQMVGTLVDYIRQSGLYRFNEIVAQAKQLFDTETNRVKLENLENLFDNQITTLKTRGTPEQIVEMLASKRSLVISKASEMIFEDRHIPFLPVIPLNYRSVYDLMSQITHNGNVGHVNLNHTAITDKVNTPIGPYWIYDVEDGETTLGKNLVSAEETLRLNNRLPLTVAEIIALITHTYVLGKHPMFAAGSRSDSADSVPAVWFVGCGPRLGWICAGKLELEWGLPSLGSR